MIGLAGDFGTMPLRDLLRYFGSRDVTGTLTLDRNGVRKVVMIEQGAVINASSNVPREYLGQFLINLGHINEEQFARAFVTQKETKVYIGRILVMIGLVNEQALAAALLLKFRETILDAYEWTDGSFTYQPVLHEHPEGVEVRLPLAEFEQESEFRVQAWEQIREAFPRGNLTLTLDRSLLAEAPRPGSIDEKVFALIEQGHSLDEMALSLHATDFFLYNRLYAFYRLGAVQLGPPKRVGSDSELGLSDGPSAEQVLDNARAFFAQSNCRDAYALARRSNHMAPSPEAAQLLEDIERSWHPQLKAEFLGAARIPLVILEPSALSRLPLSAPERYLLSRVDGSRDIGAIIRVAPLREFEALAFFDRFVRQRWIEIIG